MKKKKNPGRADSERYAGCLAFGTRPATDAQPFAIFDGERIPLEVDLYAKGHEVPVLHTVFARERHRPDVIHGTVLLDAKRIDYSGNASELDYWTVRSPGKHGFDGHIPLPSEDVRFFRLPDDMQVFPEGHRLER